MATRAPHHGDRSRGLNPLNAELTGTLPTPTRDCGILPMQGGLSMRESGVIWLSSVLQERGAEGGRF